MSIVDNLTSKGAISVRQACELAGISRGSYNYRRNNKASAHFQQDQCLRVRIRSYFAEHKQRYGSPRITQCLRQAGIAVGQKRVARLMREDGLVARPKRRYRRTTDSRHNYAIAPNLLQQDFSASAPDEVWLTDITYIATTDGFVYLNPILDVYSRKIVSYTIGSSMDVSLCTTALEQALALREPKPGLIHHSDRGSQYSADAYRDLCLRAGIERSMSRKADCYDNSMMESFFSSLEHELLIPTPITDQRTTVERVEEYIRYYNHCRMHSSIDYNTPVQWEAQWQQQKASSR